MSSEIIEKLKAIIEPYLDDEDVKVDSLIPDSHLIQDLGLDSFYVIDLVIDIENKFDINIENEQISQFETVEQVVKVIQEKLDNK